tara:strand:+ start:57032 stop:57322 length:291 start_codon:yes stop_codon:yes gene_type:complete
MKMSEEFDLPVNDSDYEQLIASQSNCGYEHLAIQEAKAIAHAINCHDELVNALEDVAEVMNGILEDVSVINVYGHFDFEYLNELESLITKAKGHQQ